MCNGIASGGGIITAQQFGAGNKENIKKAIVNSAYILIIGSIIIGAFAFFIAENVLYMMATPNEIIEDASLYMRMQCLGLPLIAIYNHVSSMLRALGDSKTPLYFLVFSCILNVGMDLYFVYVLEMGIFGAALATIIAQFIAGVGCLLYALKSNEYFKFKKEDFSPEQEMIFGTVRLGIPLSLQFSLIAVSSMALQRVVNTFGTTVMAAFTATSRVEQLLHQPYGTLNGVGDALFAFINGIVEVIGRMVVPISLTVLPFLGVWGIWWSAGVVWIVSALFSIWRYLSWKKKNPLTNTNFIVT